MTLTEISPPPESHQAHGQEGVPLPLPDLLQEAGAVRGGGLSQVLESQKALQEELQEELQVTKE